MDEAKLLKRVQFLAHFLFLDREEGKEFLHLMKLLHLMTPTFPQAPSELDKHGGPLGWAAFREGQICFIRTLEILANNYLQQIESENQPKKE